MKYTVTVTLIQSADVPPSANVSASQEIYRQSFDELDLGKLAIALNTKPRGRPAKAKKEAT